MLRRSTIPALLFVFCWIPRVVASNDALSVIPPKSILVFQIDDTKRITEALSELYPRLVDNEIDDLVLDNPFQLKDEKEWKDFGKIFEASMNELASLERLTFFVKNIEPSLEFGAILDCRNGEKGSIRKLINRLQMRQKNLLSLNDHPKGEEKGTSFGESLGWVLRGLSSLEISWVDDQCLVSNSSTMLAELVNRSRAANIKSIRDDRRFNRAYLLIKKDKKRTGFVYFKPLEFMSILYPDLEKKQFRKYGLNEVVAGGITLQVGVDLDDGTEPVIALRCYFPVTMPLHGETLNWSLYEPIDSIPNVRVSAEWERIALELANQNHLKHLKSFATMYDSIHGKGAYEKKLDRDWKKFGGFKNYRDGRSGEIGKFWFKTPNNQYQLLSFDGVSNRDAMEDSIDQYTQQSKKYPYEKTRIRGEDAWFHSDAVARRLSRANDGDDPRAIIHNRGWLLSDDWLIQGEKDHIEEYLRTEGNTNSLSRIAKSIFKGGSKVFTEESMPSYVYLRWVNGSFIHEIRKNYLTQKYGPKDASRIAFRIRTGKLPHVPIKSESDRVYAVFERLLFNWCEQFGRDATTFEFKNSHVDYRYMAFPVTD